MDEESGQISVPGGKIWYSRRGSGAATPLVVIHGGPGFPHDYLLPLAELADERPVIFYDQLGCGRSEKPNEASLWKIERFVTELARLRDELKLSRTFLFGHSWGAIPALESIIAGSSDIQGIVFASPAIDIPRWSKDALLLRRKLPQEIASTLDRLEAARDFSSPEYLQATELYYQRFVYGTAKAPDELRASMKGSGAPPYRSMWGINEFFINGSLRAYNGAASLASVQCPLLFTCGREDEATPEAVAELAQRAPRAELIVYSKSAHVPHITERERYLADVRRFLRSVDQGTWAPQQRSSSPSLTESGVAALGGWLSGMVRGIAARATRSDD